MIDALNITLSGPTGSGKSLIGGIIAKVLHERGADVEVLLDGCPSADSGIDLSGFAVILREAPEPTAATFEVTGRPVSQMSAEIRSRIIAMGIEPRRVRGVHVHPSSGLLKVRHRPLYMREAVLSEETAAEYAAWKAAKSKASPHGRVTIGDTDHVIDMPDPRSPASLKAFWDTVAAHYRSERVSDTAITLTLSGPPGAGKTRFGEYLLRALSDYGSTLGKTQDVVEQNIRRFRDSEEAGRPVYVGQFEGSSLCIGTDSTTIEHPVVRLGQRIWIVSTAPDGVKFEATLEAVPRPAA